MHGIKMVLPSSTTQNDASLVDVRCNLSILLRDSPVAIITTRNHSTSFPAPSSCRTTLHQAVSSADKTSRPRIHSYYRVHDLFTYLLGRSRQQNSRTRFVKTYKKESEEDRVEQLDYTLTTPQLLFPKSLATRAS